MTLRCTLPVLLLVAASACDYTDDGSGTGTLLVRARAEYRAGHRNETSLEVDVRRGDSPVQDATVVLYDPDLDEATTLTDEGNGEYRDDVPGFHRRFELTVEAGSDALRVRLEGPGPHLIVEPAASSRVSLSDLGGSLDVRWTVSDGLRSDVVEVELDASDYGVELQEDSGSARIAVAALAVGTEQVRVVRKNSVIPAGGVVGSFFEMRYDVRNSFDIDP